MKFLPALVLLTSSAMALSAAEESKSSPATPTPEAPKAYTDGGTTTYRTETYYNNNYPSYSSHGGYYGNMGGMGFPSTSTIRVQSRPIYFPPDAPALGQTSFATRARFSMGKNTPLGLDSHVYESFYAPLSTLLYTEDLSRKRRTKLDGYEASRAELIAELRAKLDSLAEADAPTRERELAALAQAQAPRLTALAATAEELRLNFSEGGFFESSSDWNDTRGWRLGDDARWESHADEIKVMRGYAAYQEGLSAQQRRLLRELAMELTDSIATPTADISLTAQGPYFYFSPETSRIMLPDDLPAELAAKVDAYRALKAELKKELRDTLYQHDRALFSSRRVTALKTLATAQAPRFAEVERLAEEIRRGLAPIPNPAKPPQLPLSKEVRARVTEYNRNKADLQNTILAKIDDIKKQLPKDRVEFSRLGDDYSVAIVGNRRTSAEDKEKRAAIERDLAEFNREQRKKYSALTREKNALSKELLASVTDASGRNSGKSLTQLLQQFSFSLQRQEVWELYRDYETAVLEPGLSPEQRRILFGVALDKLNLPLAN